MSAQKKRPPKIGDERWVVEWHPDAVIDEYGDFDHDETQAKAKRREFKTKEEAKTFAESVYSDDLAYGLVEVSRIEFTMPFEECPPTWETVEDAEYFNGEEWERN